MGESVHRVVVNDVGQYAIQLASADLPAGWSDGGGTGTKAECLARVDGVWTDMRPAAVRERLGG
ncbi:MULTISPECIES: MbtH family protein [unclassified Saccharothrix]|uniref:MbtH family protein n=1 Tax=unclassified Saccharothrix TaxID=2593673 RepID=UPI00307FB7DB